MASKINSKKIIVDGIPFDSKTEAKYYCRLKRLSSGSDWLPERRWTTYW